MELRDFMSQTLHIRKHKKINRLFCCFVQLPALAEQQQAANYSQSALKAKIAIRFRNEEHGHTVVIQPFSFVEKPHLSFTYVRVVRCLQHHRTMDFPSNFRTIS